VTFLREYVDELHHSKEEKVLFASLCEHGMPRNAGPIAVMHMEHAQGRMLVADLGELATTSAPWSDGVQKRANELALVFAELLASHIAKENNVLYPLAERQLTPDVLDDVGVRFAALESEFGVERRDALLASVAPRSSS
jgi:hemerythrin-like domain-containing protein